MGNSGSLVAWFGLANRFAASQQIFAKKPVCMVRRDVEVNERGSVLFLIPGEGLWAFVLLDGLLETTWAVPDFWMCEGPSACAGLLD